NRRAFFIKGAEEIIRSRRYHLPLSIIMLDIDRFKLINDTLGHDSGDYALQCVANTLVEGVREVDVVGRLGGEEFGVLLPNTKFEDAQKLADRLRTSIAENSEIISKLKMNITASFGVAEYQLQIKNLDELLKNADTAMYKAKNGGRNRVETFTSEIT
ncbi:MAG: GGDEF domain-containing protein, partial [Anaerolineaceae bacterium]